MTAAAMDDGMNDSKDRYRVQLYRPELRNQVVSLLAHLGGVSRRARESARRRPTDYFRWKYESDPHGADPLFYVVLRDRDVVAMRGMSAATWEADGRPFEIPMAGDLVIAPEHRNRGLLTRLMEFAERDLSSRGVPFALNLSAGTVTRIASLQMGWRSIGSLEPWVRNQPGSRSVWRRLKKRVRAAAPLREPGFRRLDRTANRRHGQPLTVECQPRSSAMADLVDRIGTDGRIRRLRNELFFQRRFSDAVGPFRFLFWDEERLEGYLILRASAGGSRVAILDWEATDGTIKRGLLSAAIEWGRFESLSIWAASLDDETGELLSREGFEPRARPKSIADYYPTILVRAIDRTDSGQWTLGGRHLLERDDWDIRMSYTDA